MPVTGTESHEIAICGEGIERVVGRRLIWDHLFRSVEEDQMTCFFINALVIMVGVVREIYGAMILLCHIRNVFSGSRE